MIIIVDEKNTIVGSSNSSVSMKSLRDNNQRAYIIDDSEFDPDMIGCELISYEEDTVIKDDNV